jgi:hypothetical protein
MRTTIKRMIPPCLGLWLLVPACGDDGGGDSGGDGGETGSEADASGTGGEADDGADDESGDGPDPGPPPDAYGDECGSDVYGWQTRCMVQDVTAVASDRGEIPGAPVVGDHTGRSLCCEGNPSIATADAGCEGICRLEVCEAARLDHMNGCNTCLWWDCGFDMSNCLQGGTHGQTRARFAPLGIHGYDLTAACSAFSNEEP